MNHPPKNLTRRLSELVSSQNASVDGVVNQLVEKATYNYEFENLVELRKTTEMFLLNSLMLGEAPIEADEKATDRR